MFFLRCFPYQDMTKELLAAVQEPEEAILLPRKQVMLWI